MTTGRALGRIQAFFALVGVVALVLTYLIVTDRNPLPTAGRTLTDSLARFGSLSTPEAAWQRRLGDQPTTAAVAGSAVVFGTRSGAEVHDASDGRPLWSREAHWVAVAGDGAAAAVVLGRGRDGGYDVVDPVSGGVRWHDPGIGVWAYRDALLSLACPAGRDCALSARSTTDGAARWTTALPPGARLLAGVRAAGGDLPPLLGLPVDGRIEVVDTATGSRLRAQKPTAATRVTVLGGRVIRSSAERAGGRCRYTVEARDPAGGRVVWRTDGYDPGTASGAGCEQRRDPTGAGRVLLATRDDGRAAVVSTVDGRDVWVGAPGETVPAIDGRDAVVRAGAAVALVSLDGGGTRWARRVAGDVTLTRYAVVVADRAAGRLRAYDRAGGAGVVDVETQASVLGAGPAGLVVARGRTVGVLRFTTDP
ncbi:hypothetical protein ACNTMW_16535 [Planosporangium sp. 12N6]|uniref:hypothetical protein n=1 Tax=Planosporangium spinosum TaxID=3402278 RepID=UPI003CEB79B2